MNDYQAKALKTSLVKGRDDELFYLALGLVDEAGEVAGKVKKLIRDHDGNLDAINKVEIAKEVGDVLWYVANLAEFLQIPLDDIATMNVEKLQSRQVRGKLGGSGDNR